MKAYSTRRPRKSGAAAASGRGQPGCDSCRLVVPDRPDARAAPGVTGKATRLLESHADEPFAAAVFVVCELEAGAARAAHPDRERARLRAIFQAIAIVYPDERFAPAYGDLLGRILSSGRSASLMDLLIGTCAVVEGARLVTGNAKHFSVIPDLQVLTYA